MNDLTPEAERSISAYLFKYTLTPILAAVAIGVLLVIWSYLSPPKNLGDKYVETRNEEQALRILETRYIEAKDDEQAQRVIDILESSSSPVVVERGKRLRILSRAKSSPGAFPDIPVTYDPIEPWYARPLVRTLTSSTGGLRRK